MKKELNESGYIFDEFKRIWYRRDYEGIRYSDGDEVENRISDIINMVSDISVLSEDLKKHCTDWPSEYHLSSKRSNVLRPFENELKCDVLEIGAGCGAITRYLGECGGNVLALEGTIRRASIARERTRDLENVSVVCESFEQFTCDFKFDVITLIGVLEYANLFVSGENPTLIMLQKTLSLLKPDGKLIIAIENQLGLKYFAGALEDHVGVQMYGIENRYKENQVKTFGRKSLISTIFDSGFKNVDTLAPFPDYKLPLSVVAESGFNTKNFDYSALACQSVRNDPQLPKNLVFSPELVWPVVAENEIALELSNSFIFIAYRKNMSFLDAHLLAWHFSTDRKKQYCKTTTFVKSPLSNTIDVRYNLIMDSKQKDSNIIKFNIPESEPYIYGKSLSQMFIKTISEDGWCVDDVKSLVDNFFQILVSIAYSDGVELNVNSGSSFLPGSFFDAVPQNIIINNDGLWNLIDKEWELNENISAGYLLFRSLVLLINSTTKFGIPHDQSIVTPYKFIESIFESVGFYFDESLVKEYINQDIKINEIVTAKKVNINDVMLFLNSDQVFNFSRSFFDQTKHLQLEQAKAKAESIAYSRYEELKSLSENLQLMSKAKEEAELLAYSRYEELKSLSENLQLMSKAKEEAELLAYSRYEEVKILSTYLLEIKNSNVYKLFSKFGLLKKGFPNE